MNRSKDIIYTLAAISCFVIAFILAIFLICAIFMPYLFRLGSVADKFNFVLTHLNMRWFFLHMAYVWTFVGIPAGVGLLFLIKERNPARAYIGALFWFSGVFMQFMTYSFMFSVVRRTDQGLLDLSGFAVMDNASFLMELSGILLFCLAMLIFAPVLIQGQGLKKIVGRLFIANSLTCFFGGVLIGVSYLPLNPWVFYNFGMFFYGGIGAVIAVISFNLLMLIFRKEAEALSRVIR